MATNTLPASSASTPARLLTSNEVAELCRCTPGTVREWHKSGRLSRAVRVGGKLLWREADVLALIAPPSDEELT